MPDEGSPTMGSTSTWTVYYYTLLCVRPSNNIVRSRLMETHSAHTFLAQKQQQRTFPARDMVYNTFWRTPSAPHTPAAQDVRGDMAYSENAELA